VAEVLFYFRICEPRKRASLIYIRTILVNATASRGSTMRAKNGGAHQAQAKIVREEGISALVANHAANRKTQDEQAREIAAAKTEE
jgi:hypothetical protein